MGPSPGTSGPPGPSRPLGSPGSPGPLRTLGPQDLWTLGLPGTLGPQDPWEITSIVSNSESKHPETLKLKHK